MRRAIRRVFKHDTEQSEWIVFLLPPDYSGLKPASRPDPFGLAALGLDPGFIPGVLGR